DSGKAKEALATLDELRKLPPPAADDPRIDLEEANAASTISDFERQRGAAARAAQRGIANGSRILVARARGQEGKDPAEVGGGDGRPREGLFRRGGSAAHLQRRGPPPR